MEITSQPDDPIQGLLDDLDERMRSHDRERKLVERKK
jgi:hypothetical protein